MPDLELAGVTRRFGDGNDTVVALEPVDLAIEHDEVVALVGPSGCGKTTLLRMVAGLTAPSQGSIRVDGREVWADPRRPDRQALEQLGVVFQEANLLPWMRVEANVALPLRLRGVGRAERRERARALCRLTGIDGFGHRRPSDLSIGMRQRAALARAIIDSPKVLLLDEPFAALDAMTRESLNQELQRVHREQPCTTVLVTHSISEAVLLADRVVSLTARPGRVAGVTAVPFPRPRPLALQHTAEFQAVVREVRTLLEAVSAT
jgi:NitT/TauT family transport system ATP-binding protein